MLRCPKHHLDASKSVQVMLHQQNHHLDGQKDNCPSESLIGSIRWTASIEIIVHLMDTLAQEVSIGCTSNTTLLICTLWAVVNGWKLLRFFLSPTSQSESNDSTIDQEKPQPTTTNPTKPATDPHNPLKTKKTHQRLTKNPLKPTQNKPETSQKHT
jgi:hypothetical protein